MNGLQAWLRRNGCCTKTAGIDTPMTHTIMSGGKLYVPEDLYDEFLGMYARAMNAVDKTLTYSEIRSSEVFRMYFDLDMLEKTVMDNQSVLDIVREVQKTVAVFFTEADNETLKCVVSRTQTKEVERKTLIPILHDPEEKAGDADAEAAPKPTHTSICETFVKNGVHLNFPRLLVNLDIALQIRFSVVNHLEMKFGQRSAANNPWSDVIDKAPYFNGLKMIGSVKTAQCKTCDTLKKKKNCTGNRQCARQKVLREIAKIRKKYYNRQDDTFDYSNMTTLEGDEFKNFDLANLHTEYQELTHICPQCNNKGWYLENRCYSPSHVLGSDGEMCCDDLAYITKDLHEQMRWTSIRARAYDQITAGYRVPTGHPSPTTDTTSACLSAFGSAGLQCVSPGLYRDMLNSDVHVQDAKCQSRWRGDIIKDVETLHMITMFVRGLHQKYKNVVVKEAMELKTGKQTDDSSTTIQSGPGKGLTVKKKASKAGGKLATKLAVANNTTISKNILLRVYTSIVVRVSGEGSRYCQNKGDEHTTNSVYFCISKQGVTQMCHSAKDTLRLSGQTCRKYHSPSTAVPVALAKRLFTEELGINMDAVKGGVTKRSGDDGRVVVRKMKKKNKIEFDKWNKLCR